VPQAEFGPFKVATGKPAEFMIAANASDEDPLAIGRPAPEFTLVEPERGGAPVSLSSLQGRAVVLNFYCGCAWCEAVAETWAKSPPLAEGTELIAILNDQTLSTTAGIRRFRSRTGFTGRILVDPSHEVTLLYGSSECPRVWVIDGGGTIRNVNASRTEAPERIVREATEAVGRSLPQAEAATPAAAGS
jgi:peroxiredoxin